MRVLIATGLYAPEIGGPATHTSILEDQFRAMGIEVVVYPFSVVRSYPKVIRHLVYVFGLMRRARGVSVLYALDPVSVGFPALIASRLTHTPLVLRVAGDYAWEQATQRFGVHATLDQFVVTKSGKSLMVRVLEYVERLVARHAVRIIVPSNYLKRIVSLWGVREEKVITIYNAFTPPEIKDAKAVLRERFGFREITLLSAGRLVPWKGFKTLIDVVAHLRREGIAVMLAIAGDGPERAELIAHAAEGGVADYVHFLGRLPQSDLMQAIAGADIFVLNTGYEGFSHLLLEVMALGVPIVTTPVGGNTELITDGESGLLVAHNDKKALERAIFQLMEHPEDSARFVVAAREHAHSFTPERMAASVQDVLARVSKQS